LAYGGGSATPWANPKKNLEGLALGGGGGRTTLKGHLQGPKFIIFFFCHGVAKSPPPPFQFFFYIFSLFLNKIIKKNEILKRRRFRVRCQCWRGQMVTQPNGVNKIGWKIEGRTQFKNAKKLRSKCLKLKSDGSFSNRASTQEFVIHLPVL
jgi:hypothetical protein